MFDMSAHQLARFVTLNGTRATVETGLLHARGRPAGCTTRQYAECLACVVCVLLPVCTEVKNQELFGVQSGHFVGGSHGKGLAEQVAHMLTVAAAPEQKRRGRSPQVVVFFPSGVDPEVAAALTKLGAKVANGPGSLAPLCGVVGNNVTNLDVTTLCALVSEVTWRDPHSQALKDWAARTSHWRVSGIVATTHP